MTADDRAVTDGASGPAYGFFGDDFTGATDTLAHLARAGLRTVLFLRTPDADLLARAGTLDAIGIAGATRAASPEAIRKTVGEAGAHLAGLGVRLMHYKVCSTFDSAPHVGNIAVAVDALRATFPHPLVAIVGGQPNLQRYCVFSQLFAAGGDGVVRIDRHPTMAHHPVTPMDEADLRVHLAAQGLRDIAAIDWRQYATGPSKVAAAVDAAIAGGAHAVLFDVLTPAHLEVIGHVLRRAAGTAPMIAVGPSSVAQAWAGAGRTTGMLSLAAPDGPVLVLAGSLSPMSARQIEGARRYTRIALDPADLLGREGGKRLAAHVARIVAALRDGKHVLAYTLRPEHKATTLEGARVAQACAGLLAQVLAEQPVRRVCVGGGDTSSFAMQALPAWGLTYAGSLPAGVTVCRLRADDVRLDGVEIILKGGQMGEATLFDDLVTPPHLAVAWSARA